MMCEERAGFLFARACDQMSAWSCARCHKPICVAHTRTTSQGQACIGCARAIMAEEQQAQGTEQRTSDEASTRTYEDTDDPYFYHSNRSWGSREHYDADDRRAFDAAANEEPEGSWEQDPSGS
jgi:hypothetical protein